MNANDPDYVVGYLGPEGTFSHEACRLAVEHLCGQGALPTVVPVLERAYRSIAAILQDTTDARCVGVVPILNTAVGLIEDSYMAFSPRLMCLGEVSVSVRLALLSRAPTIEGVLTVASKDAALDQVAGWLDRRLPQAERLAVESTVAAVQLARDDPTVAAVASEFASTLYDIAILARDLQGRNPTRTFFAILSAKGVRR